MLEKNESKEAQGGAITSPKQDMFKQNISREVWKSTYRWEGEKTVDETFDRVAKAIADAEKNKELKDKYHNTFRELLKDFKFVPGGRILSNAGTNLKGTTLINCFVGGFKGKNQDSVTGIYKALGEQAQTLKSEGGYGFCIDVLRPEGAYIEGIANRSPGALEFAKLWNTSSAVVTKGSTTKSNKGKEKIRKGAQMITNSCWHPDVIKFINAKLIPGQFDKFNMSVLITNKFIDAVEKDLDWDLVFPDTTHENYDSEWDGNLEKWLSKYPESVVVYQTLKARELWDMIMTATYTRNEPGVLFVDRINELNNLYYCEYISATNPCGEQPLAIDNVCDLGSFNLVMYVKDGDWDYEALERDIPSAVRFLDNVLTVSKYPLDAQREQAHTKRRIGIGYLGYGSALYLMGIPYGSKKALELTDKLCSFVTNKIYQASAYLAKEKGSFAEANINKLIESNFYKQALTKETIEIIKDNGIRNSHTTMIAPTGNTGIFANNVSGGHEPVVSVEYVRTIIVPIYPDEIKKIEVDWSNKKYTFDGDKKFSDWKWTKEGDEDIIVNEINGVLYKFDRNRGLTKEEKVMDYAVQILIEQGKFDEAADYLKTIFNLSPKEHIDTMKVFAKYIDAGISKTINLPNDFKYEDFKDIYMDAFKAGTIKGFTTYRWGTMTSVISSETTKLKEEEEEFRANNATKRRKTLDADVYKVNVQGEKWIVFVGKLLNKPYEVFAGKVDLVDVPSSIKRGTITKAGKGVYQFEHDGEVLVKDITKIFANDVHDNITRLVSTSLRHGTEVKFIVEQLNKAHGIVTNFSKSLARALKHYIEDGAKSTVKCFECGSSNVVFKEGCHTCMDCGSSKCG